MHFSDPPQPWNLVAGLTWSLEITFKTDLNLIEASLTLVSTQVLCSNSGITYIFSLLDTQQVDLMASAVAQAASRLVAKQRKQQRATVAKQTRALSLATYGDVAMIGGVDRVEEFELNILVLFAVLVFEVLDASSEKKYKNRLSSCIRCVNWEVTASCHTGHRLSQKQVVTPGKLWHWATGHVVIRGELLHRTCCHMLSNQASCH